MNILRQATIVFFKLVTFSLIVSCRYAMADACVPQSGSPVIGSADISQFVSSPDNDYVGYTQDYNIMNVVPAGNATCGCSHGESNSFWDWANFLVPTENVNNKTYGILNDYIGIAVMPRPDTNRWAPYSDLQAEMGPACGTMIMGGGAGTAQLRVRKKIIGTVIASNILFYQKGTNTYQGESMRVPEIQIQFYGTISVPQNCELDTGEIINIDFGDISATKFTTKGQKPTGFLPITKTVAVKCSGGVDAAASLTVRFQATPSPAVSTAIMTDNPDVAVMITDQNGNIVMPNTGLIPLQLANSQASYMFQTYPISATGAIPGAGLFTALAYMRIDYA